MSKKILVIDDSALMRRVISDIINKNNDYEVSAIAKDGVEGFEMIVSNPNTYSAIILDINMPKMNGLELLAELQKNRIEQTVIVVSTVAKEGAKETIKALELGAFDFVTKPENYLETKSDEFKKRIYDMLNVATSTKATLERVGAGKPSGRVEPAAAIPAATTDRPSTFAERVAARKAAREAAQSATAQTAATTSRSAAETRTAATEDNSEALLALRRRNETANEQIVVNAKEFEGVKRGKKKLIALACSTGGPKSLQRVIPNLPKNLDAGMVLVQHMPKGFTQSLAVRLNEISQVTVKEAENGDVIQKGWVYIAPGGQHMKVVQKGSDYVIQLSDEPAIDGLRPCANIMYQSLQHCVVDELTCVVLTGMGADGTKGIKELSEAKKNMHVIAQDEDSCVVYGMPRAIAQAGLADEVVTLNQVATAITKNVGVS